MHFRIRGNNVQVVKSEADESGKKRPLAVGSFKRQSTEIPAELSDKLSKEELAEVKSWMEFNAHANATKAKAAAFGLPEQIALTAEWLNSVDKTEATFVVDSILESMRVLRKAMADKA